ncbi:MAG: hypothetical protein K8S98_14680 [Planctomycetes bacterium]|nr:hypothetical protein [Planctomycetota bacterium]
MAVPICIQCGQTTAEPQRLNRLPDGKICAACRDRLMASIPPALPASTTRVGRTGSARSPRAARKTTSRSRRG